MSDEPAFYEEEEDESVKNSMEENFKPDISKEEKEKKEEDYIDLNCSFEKNNKKKEYEEELNISMSMVKNDPNKKEKNKIPEKIFKENQEEPSLASFINKSDKNSEDNEPNFYDDEEEIEVNNTIKNDNIKNNSIDFEEDSKYNNYIKEFKKIDKEENEEINGPYNINDIKKYHDIIKKDKEDLKKKNIDINNIFEINELFDYDKDNPVFYLKENKQALDRYPWPLSTKQIKSIIEKENLDYHELRVKLVDIFEFKLKDAFSYVDFINVIKPEWAKNVKCSRIFMDLHNFMNGKKNKSKIDKPEDKTEPIKISESTIPKVSQTNTNSEVKKLNNLFNDKKEIEKEIEKKEVKQYNPGKNARKAKKRRQEKGDAKLKVGFSYD